MRAGLIFFLGLTCGAALTLGAVKLWRRPAARESRAEISGSDMGAIGGRAAGAAVEDRGPPETRSLAESIALVKKAAGRTAIGADNYERDEAINAWGEKDALGALTFIAGARRFPDRLRALGQVLGILGRRDPAAAARWMMANFDPFERNMAGSSLLWELQSESPRQALQLAQALGLKEGDALAGVFESLAKLEPREALQGFERLEESARTEVAQRMTQAWAEKDFSAAYRWCEAQQKSPHFTGALGGLLTACLEHHPEELAEVLQRFPTAAEHVPAHGLSDLFDRDVAEGLRASGMVPVEVKTEALAQWAQRALAADPERVLAAIKAALPEGKQQEALLQAFPGWIYSDRKSALEWLAAQPEGPQKRALAERIEAEQAQVEPRATLKRLEGGAPNELSRSAADAALQAWANNDPVGAAAWAKANAALTPPSALAAIAEQYLANDEEAAVTWLAGLPSGAGRDAAAARAAYVWVQKDELDIATQTAHSIADPQKKVGTLFSMFQSLTSGDKGRAEAWLATQPLSDEVKANWRAIVVTP